jgi:hypothetical protein
VSIVRAYGISHVVIVLLLPRYYRVTGNVVVCCSSNLVREIAPFHRQIGHTDDVTGDVTGTRMAEPGVLAMFSYRFVLIAG